MESAEQIRMSRAQRDHYQAKVAEAVRDANEQVPHSNYTYTFVVDYGQNMELPSYQGAVRKYILL